MRIIGRSIFVKVIIANVKIISYTHKQLRDLKKLVLHLHIFCFKDCIGL